MPSHGLRPGGGVRAGSVTRWSLIQGPQSIFMPIAYNLRIVLPLVSCPRPDDTHDHSSEEDTSHHESQAAVTLELRLEDKVSSKQLHKSIVNKDTSTDSIEYTGDEFLLPMTSQSSNFVYRFPVDLPLRSHHCYT